MQPIATETPSVSASRAAAGLVERHAPDSGEQLTDDELRAWRGFLRSHQAICRALDAQLSDEAGIPLAHYDVLVQLSNAGGQLRMRDLAGRLLLSRSGVTRLIDRLDRDGLVTRRACAQDGRGQYACITEPGRELLAVARPGHIRGVRSHLLRLLSDEDLVQLGDIFTRALRQLERETGESLL